MAQSSIRKSYTDAEILVKNSPIPRRYPGKRLPNGRRETRLASILKKYKPYTCSNCDNDGQWLGKELVLQVDHIDGDNKNNELENLRFMCPNCHTQTPTHSVNKKIIKEKEIDASI